MLSIITLHEKISSGQMLGNYFKKKHPKKSPQQVKQENKTMRKRFVGKMKELAPKHGVKVPKGYK